MTVLRHVRYLKAVVEHGSFTRAAQALHVSQPALSQQIKELEEKINVGDTLFIISSKSGTTTEPNAFYAYFHEKVSKQVGSAQAGRTSKRRRRESRCV